MTAEGPSVEERIRTNYNATGVAVLQHMYSDGYLSMGGRESTETLARLAGITADALVLDIGCGIGGPALHLAQSLGCRVVGIDLVESSIVTARQCAHELGLGDRAVFDVADATALPFADAQFDVVWGQDAWCHVGDTAALIDEAARVLKPGGTLAFTDWLAGSGMSGAERAAALDAAVSKGAASEREYLDVLADAGFVDVDHADISASFIEQYQQIYDGLRLDKNALIERFGQRVYTIVADMNGTILRGFEASAIEGGRFLATKPA